jgi:tRNA pseudouridine55 synthase
VTDAPERGDRPSVGDGLVVVDKPPGWTSHDVVARTRRLAATRKVGHAGTLDPMATGVLVLGVNRATRLLTYLVGADKAYTATIRLGVATVTDDAEGDATEITDALAVTESTVRQAVSRLTGAIQQVPSAVSAIKVDGKRSYARVRAGEDVQLAARPVTVHRFEVLATRRAEHDRTPVLDVDVEVDCSSGTYVRALARDLGGVLGVGGHLTALRRTRVGPFGLADAATLEAMAAELRVVPVADAARALFPVRAVGDDEVVELGFGRRLPAAASDGERPVVAALAADGRLIALLAERDGTARPLVVFEPS